MSSDKNDDKAFEELPWTEWQKTIIDERLNDYYQNPKSIMDFDKTIDDIEQSLLS